MRLFATWSHVDKTKKETVDKLQVMSCVICVMILEIDEWTRFIQTLQNGHDVSRD